MDNNNAIDTNKKNKNSVHEVIAELKRRKCEDEKEFLQEITDPEHQKRIELLRGKIVKNESVSAR